MTYYPGTNSPYLAETMGMRLDGPLYECDACKSVLRIATDRPPPAWFFRAEAPKGWVQIGKGGSAQHHCPRCKGAP